MKTFISKFAAHLDAARIRPNDRLKTRPQLPTPPRRSIWRAAPALHIPCADPAPEEALCAEQRGLGRSLALEGRWDALSLALAAADARRAKTPAGKPEAELIAQGARAALAPRLERIMAGRFAEQDILLRVLAERALTDPFLAAVLAMAHVDHARTRAGPGSTRRGRQTARRHFDRAIALVDPFDSAETGSPLVAAACCGLLGGREDARHRIAAAYETLIDLDPLNPAPMRALGRQLLQTAFAEPGRLELEAVRTAARTRDVWGEGGYTWVMLDAIGLDDAACAALDVDFFIDGLHDILDRSPTQATVNLFAAACARAQSGLETAQGRAGPVRTRISACADWIVRNHMRELHPMIWLEAWQGDSGQQKQRSTRRRAEAGRDHALTFIAALFGAELAAGQSITFTDRGPMTDPG